MEHRKGVLAIDLGASGGRGILALFDGNRISMEEIHRFEHNYSVLRNRAYWNLPGLYEHIKTAIGNCGGRAVSLGIDTWGVDFGLLDANGELYGFPRSYRDAAFSRENMEEFAAKFGGCSALHQRTGIACHGYNTLFQLWALRKEGGLNGAAQAMMLPNLLEYLLCGQRHSDYSAISTSQLFQMERHCYDTELLAALGLPADFFPPVDYAGEKLGMLKTDIAEQTCRLQVISVQGHDTANAASAIPTDAAGYTFLSSGTWSLIGVVTSQPALLGSGISNEGIGRALYRPTINIPGMWILQECRRQWIREGKHFSYAQMAQMAAEEGGRPVSFIKPEDFEYAGNYPQMIRDYCAATGQPVPETDGQVVNTVLVSLALRYRMAYGQLHPEGGKEPVYIVGGGSNNYLLNQMTANAIGVPVIKGPTEATALGNVLTQLEALGYISGNRERCEVIRNSFESRIWEPEEAEYWEEVYAHFLRQYLKT